MNNRSRQDHQWVLGCSAPPGLQRKGNPTVVRGNLAPSRSMASQNYALTEHNVDTLQAYLLIQLQSGTC